MGWTVSYQVLRDRPLEPHEVVKLAELVRRQRKQPWDAEPFSLSVPTAPRADFVIATGLNKVSMGDGSSDRDLVMAAANELHALLGGELRVADDFRVLTRTAQPIHVPYAELVDVTTLVAAPPVEVARGDGIPELVAKLVECTDYKLTKPIEERLAQQDPVELARFVYRGYALLGKNGNVRSALSSALARLRDPSVVIPEFLAAWSNPNGTYFYGDMPKPTSFASAIARDPRVFAQMVADLELTLRDPSEMRCRCASSAIDILCAGGHTREIVAAIRARRGRTLATDEKYKVFAHAHTVLATSKDPRVVATLLRFIGTEKSFGSALRVVDGLVTLAPDRVRPYVMAFARRGVHRRKCIEWLRVLGDPEGLSAGLVARGNAPLEERAIDVDLDTRHDALREIHKRLDPSTYVSLVLAELLDKFLRARTDYPGLPFSWHEWRDKLPPGEAIEGTAAKKLKWYELVGKNWLGPQVIWPSVKVLMEQGPAAVAPGYPSELIELDAETIAALEREETAAFGA